MDKDYIIRGFFIVATSILFLVALVAVMAPIALGAWEQADVYQRFVLVLMGALFLGTFGTTVTMEVRG